MDEGGHNAVLDQVGALLRARHPEERAQIGDRDADRHSDLAPTRAALHPMRDKGDHQQEPAERE